VKALTEEWCSLPVYERFHATNGTGSELKDGRMGTPAGPAGGETPLPVSDTRLCRLERMLAVCSLERKWPYLPAAIERWQIFTFSLFSIERT
jgi:hypothetical protein